MGFAGFIVVLLSWALFFTNVYSAGVAVPEIISASGVMPWIGVTAIRIYRLNRN